MDTVGTRLWRERVSAEQAATLRAHPMDPASTRHTRDCRLRQELDLILRSDPRLNLRPQSVHHRRSESPRRSHKGSSKSSSKKREGAVTARPAIPHPPKEIGVHTALPVSEAGSLTSRQLAERRITFKNMESNIWG